MASPINPRLIKRATATKNFLVAVGLVGVVQSVFVLAQATLLARSIAHVFYFHDLDGVAVDAVLLVAIFTLRGGLTWLTSVLAHRASADVKTQLRHDVLAARLDAPVKSTTRTGELIHTVTTGLDALDGYFAKFLPQFIMALLVPIIVGVAIGMRDFESVIIVIITVPLIPIFMILIGWTVSDQVARRFKVQGRLANHFADLVAGLPTLQVFGRALAARRGLQETEAANRTETMSTLKVAFLSAFVLELAATLSVALIAVTIGFSALYGRMGLEEALYILILAPEVYLPLRQVGAHFHDSSNGTAAADAAFAVIDEGRSSSLGTAEAVVSFPESDEVRSAHEAAHGVSDSAVSVESANSAKSAKSAAAVESAESTERRSTFAVNQKVSGASSGTSSGVAVSSGPVSSGNTSSGAISSSTLSGRTISFDASYSYGDGHGLPQLSFEVASGEIVALAGRSGTGKSTAISLLLGFLEPTTGHILSDGVPISDLDRDAWLDSIAYVGQHPGMLPGTVGDNIALGFEDAHEAQLRAALDLVGGEAIELTHPVGDDGEGLSGGELRRVAMARAFLKTTLGGARLLVMDEPTAGLDAASETRAIEAIRDLNVAAVIVTHRPAVLALADKVIDMPEVGDISEADLSCSDDGSEDETVQSLSDADAQGAAGRIESGIESGVIA